MKARFIGGILLIVGTSIGGGMLALPVANATIGFWQSSLFLFCCWSVMTLGALFILEANLYLPRGKHMVSMAAATLGAPGLVVSWLSYLGLLYTLLAAYISGGTDILGSLSKCIGFYLTSWQASLLFTLLFGLIVYSGIRHVDLLNRVLMFTKLAIYFILIILITPHIDIHYLHGEHSHYMTSSLMILITSFGFSIIVPNLRDYFDDDIPTLKRVILIGSLIPLLCYIAWDAVIMGCLPSTQLIPLITSTHTTSQLAFSLSTIINNTTISSLFNFFVSVCMLTAFLGVSLCLISFLADGLKMVQKGKQGFGLFLLTFLPPLFIVIYCPGAYIYALNYAGLFCVILLLLLPALMVLFGRTRFTSSYRVPGGTFIIYIVIIISIALFINECYLALI